MSETESFKIVIPSGCSLLEEGTLQDNPNLIKRARMMLNTTADQIVNNKEKILLLIETKQYESDEGKNKAIANAQKLFVVISKISFNPAYKEMLLRSYIDTGLVRGVFKGNIDEIPDSVFADLINDLIESNEIIDILPLN